MYNSDLQKEDELLSLQPREMVNFTEMIEMGDTYSDDDSGLDEEFLQILKRKRQLVLENEFSIAKE